MEALLASLFDAFFSDSNVELDKYFAGLLGKTGAEWVPIALFSSPMRLGRIASDEAVVAKAVRRYSCELEVSDDGKMIRKRNKSRGAERARRKGFYLEHLPPGSTIKSLLAHSISCGISISCIRLPLSSILYQANFSNSDALSFNSNLLKLLDYNPSLDIADINEFRLPAFVFIETQGGKPINSCFGSAWATLQIGSHMNAIKYLQNVIDEGAALNEWAHVRVLKLIEWHNRMDEYQTLLHTRRAELAKVVHAKTGTHAGASFEPGVIVKYTGVHKHTSRKLIKHADTFDTSNMLQALFELIAPVTFIDYTKGSEEGFARFKSRHGASLCHHYFSKQTIVQTHAHDSGTLITSLDQLSKLKQRHKAKSSASNVITAGWDEWDDPNDDLLDYAEQKEEEEFSKIGVRVIVLEGAEEQSYWEGVYEKQQESRNSFSSHRPSEFNGHESHYSEYDSHHVDTPTWHTQKAKPPLKEKLVESNSHVKFDDHDDVGDKLADAKKGIKKSFEKSSKKVRNETNSSNYEDTSNSRNPIKPASSTIDEQNGASKANAADGTGNLKRKMVQQKPSAADSKLNEINDAGKVEVSNEQDEIDRPKKRRAHKRRGKGGKTTAADK
ncbi:hypothetical protein HDU80_010982 [Chytriomyces hyalinus]|nr:hypothetical protein HDU80_010982 [Chytriomyces hyalinus]